MKSTHRHWLYIHIRTIASLRFVIFFFCIPYTAVFIIDAVNIPQVYSPQTQYYRFGFAAVRDTYENLSKESHVDHQSRLNYAAQRQTYEFAHDTHLNQINGRVPHGSISFRINRSTTFVFHFKKKKIDILYNRIYLTTWYMCLALNRGQRQNLTVLFSLFFLIWTLFKMLVAIIKYHSTLFRTLAVSKYKWLRACTPVTIQNSEALLEICFQKGVD